MKNEEEEEKQTKIFCGQSNEGNNISLEKNNNILSSLCDIYGDISSYFFLCSKLKTLGFKIIL